MNATHPPAVLQAYRRRPLTAAIRRQLGLPITFSVVAGGPSAPVEEDAQFGPTAPGGYRRPEDTHEPR